MPCLRAYAPSGIRTPTLWLESREREPLHHSICCICWYLLVLFTPMTVCVNLLLYVTLWSWSRMWNSAINSLIIVLSYTVSAFIMHTADMHSLYKSKPLEGDNLLLQADMMENTAWYCRMKRQNRTNNVKHYWYCKNQRPCYKVVQGGRTTQWTMRLTIATSPRWNPPYMCIKIKINFRLFWPLTCIKLIVLLIVLLSLLLNTAIAGYTLFWLNSNSIVSLTMSIFNFKTSIHARLINNIHTLSSCFSWENTVLIACLWTYVYLSQRCANDIRA